jgi:hypothetical protein
VKEETQMKKTSPSGLICSYKLQITFDQLFWLWKTTINGGNKTTILKTAADFTKDQLIKAGYTLKTSGELNPASISRAEQVEQIIKTHF